MSQLTNDSITKIFNTFRTTIEHERNASFTPSESTTFQQLIREYLLNNHNKNSNNDKVAACNHSHGDHHHHHHHDDDEHHGDNEDDGEALAKEALDRMRLIEHLRTQLHKYRVILKRNLPDFGKLQEVLYPPRVEDSLSSTAPTSKSNTIAATDQPLQRVAVSGAPPQHAPMIDVDAFLYDEEDINMLCDRGVLSRDYCKACGSMSIGQTEFISHSFSVEQLLYLFVYAIPLATMSASPLSSSQPTSQTNQQQQDDKKKALKIVDVGSRLGIVLAAAHGTATFWASRRISLFSSVVGIELNGELCRVQQASLTKANVISDGRVKRVAPSKRQRPETTAADSNSAAASASSSIPVSVVHGDALDPAHLTYLQDSDLVVLHNVFEWFVEPEKQLAVWITLRQTLRRPGTILIAVPNFVESITVSLARSAASDSTEDSKKKLRETLIDEVYFFGQSSSLSQATKREELLALSDENVVKAVVDSWVEMIDVTSAQDAFIEEHLMANMSGGAVGGDDEHDGEGDDAADVDDETKGILEESKELVKSIIFYHVK